MARDWFNAVGDWNSNTESWEGEAEFPAKADLTLTGHIPQRSLGTVIIPSVGAVEIISTYSWETYGGTWAAATTDWETNPSIPLVTVGLNELPGYATLTITGFGPDVDIKRLYYVPSASMTTTLYIPYAFAGHMAFPGAGTLDLNPDKVVWDNWVGDWDSATETWNSLVDTRPSVDQTFSFDPTTGELVLAGQQPDPQHRAPKFLPSVQVI